MKKAQRPIDVKDTLWSHIGKDALDAAAEASWEVMRNHGLVWNCVEDEEMPPYHVISTREQTAVQRVVLSVLGSAVPKMLRQRAKGLKADGASVGEVDSLLDLAEELEDEHG